MVVAEGPDADVGGGEREPRLDVLREVGVAAGADSLARRCELRGAVLGMAGDAGRLVADGEGMRRLAVAGAALITDDALPRRVTGVAVLGDRVSGRIPGVAVGRRHAPPHERLLPLPLPEPAGGRHGGRRD